MPNYFLLGASKDHVLKGLAGGFAQAGHGRKDLMSQPERGDWIIFYSAKDKLDGGKPLQKFTAIGQITDDQPYKVDTNPDFKPYRRDAHYLESHEAEIRPLLEALSFIKNKQKWGFHLLGGFRKISEDDFLVIRHAMEQEKA